MSLARNPSLFYGYGRRRRVGRKRHGRGFFADVGNAFSRAHDFVKKNKLVSTVANALGSVGVPYAGAIGKAASLVGYGRRRRVGRPRVRRSGMGRRIVHRRRRPVGGARRRVHRRQHRRVGGAFNLRGALTLAHNFAKKHQLASKALHHLGHPKAAAAVSSLGYGRRRVHRRRVMHRHRGGGSLFGSITQPALLKF
jgi:hypothetical protein